MLERERGCLSWPREKYEGDGGRRASAQLVGLRDALAALQARRGALARGPRRARPHEHQRHRRTRAWVSPDATTRDARALGSRAGAQRRTTHGIRGGRRALGITASPRRSIGHRRPLVRPAELKPPARADQLYRARDRARRDCDAHTRASAGHAYGGGGRREDADGVTGGEHPGARDRRRNLLCRARTDRRSVLRGFGNRVGAGRAAGAQSPAA